MYSSIPTSYSEGFVTNNNESDKTTAEQNVYAVKLTLISGQAHSTVLFTLPTRSLDS